MNLSKRDWSVCILVLLFVLLTVLSLPLLGLARETFANPPVTSLPPVVPDDPKVVAANTNYASLLQFIKENPSKSAKFIMDIRQKFFNNECQVKEYINFDDITTFSDGAPFT